MSLATLEVGLGGLGFRKRSGQIFTLDLGEGVLGWLGLNRTARRPSGEVGLNPVVGVRYQGIERVVSRLRAEAFHSYQPPTVSSPLGYLMPEGRFASWIVGGAGSGEAEADLVGSVTRFAVPFMSDAKGLHRIGELLDGGVGIAHQLVYRQPVARTLLGDRAGADEIVDAALSDLGDRTDAAAVEYRDFAVRFSEWRGPTDEG